jgi:hypothetical protein
MRHPDSSWLYSLGKSNWLSRSGEEEEEDEEKKKRKKSRKKRKKNKQTPAHSCPHA